MAAPTRALTVSRAPIHIAISTWGVSGGAMAMVAAGLANGLTRLGCTVDVLRVDHRTPSDHLEFAEQVRHTCLDRRSLTSFIPLSRYLRVERPDVLVTIGWTQNAPGLVARALARSHCLLLLSEHSVLSYKALVEHRSHPILRRMAWFARHFYRYADAVVAVSEDVRADLASLGVPSSLLSKVIPNAVDSDRIRRLALQPCQPIAPQGGEPLFVSVGRLARQKNHALLIRAFSRFRNDVGVGKLVIAGDGPLRGELEALVAELRLADSVHLSGYSENPYPLIAEANAFVLSSDEEGFGLVLVEAMALGTPIVAVDCPGGVAEVVDHGNAALLVPPHSERGLSDAMKTVLEDDELRAKLINTGHRRSRRFDPVLIAQEWLSLIDKILFRKAGCTKLL